jgi:NADP-dependent 3-hydroxy acid dehydrogenase YdfG
LTDSQDCFQDRVAMITGASGGIGGAIALALAEKRSRLYLLGRNENALKKIAQTAGKLSPQVVTFVADFTKDQDLDRVVDDFDSKFEHLDMMIHNAGSFTMAPMEQSSIQDLDDQYQVNVRAPYFITQRFLTKLKESNGQIAFVNSTVGADARAGVGQYAASKHALKALADSLREEVNPFGIRVLTIFLGRTATAMQREVHRMENKPYHPETLIQPEDVASVILNTFALPRTSEITEIKIRPLKKPGS